MSGVQDFTFTAVANSTIDGIVISENCPAANINNAIRALMSDVMQELVYQGDISASASMSLAGVGWRMSSVSGSASIIHVGTGRAGLVRILRWNSPSTLVGSANIITDGGGNIVTATNDVTTFTSFGSGAWRAVHDSVSGIPAVYTEAITSSATTTDFLLMKSAAGVAKLVAASDTPGVTTGTFTPTVAFGGASVGVVYVLQEGRYTRVGNLITYSIYIQISNAGSSTGNATVGGLPVTAVATPTQNVAAMGGLGSTFSSVSGNPFGFIAGASTQIVLGMQSASGSTSLTKTNFTNTSTFAITGAYFV